MKFSQAVKGMLSDYRTGRLSDPPYDSALLNTWEQEDSAIVKRIESLEKIYDASQNLFNNHNRPDAAPMDNQSYLAYCELTAAVMEYDEMDNGALQPYLDGNCT